VGGGAGAAAIEVERGFGGWGGLLQILRAESAKIRQIRVICGLFERDVVLRHAGGDDLRWLPPTGSTPDGVSGFMHLLQRRLVDSRRDAKSELQQPVQLWLQPLNQAAAARLHQQTDCAQHRDAKRLRRAARSSSKRVQPLICKARLMASRSPAPSRADNRTDDGN